MGSFLITTFRTYAFAYINYHLAFRGPDVNTRWRHGYKDICVDGLDYVYNGASVKGADEPVAAAATTPVLTCSASRSPQAAPPCPSR
jgi:hypothetical protein